MVCYMKTSDFKTEDMIITGYTTRRHLLLDLDNTKLPKAVSIVNMVMDEWPEVGDCLILNSSNVRDTLNVRYSWNGAPYHKREGSNYHLVFDGLIGWNKAAHICETLAGLRILEKDYEKIRTFRGDMTLRISPAMLSTGLKPAPVCVCAIKNKRYGGSGSGIFDYLNTRRDCADFGLSVLDTNNGPNYRAYRPDDQAHILPVGVR